MKNLKEVQAILTSIYCINFTSKHRDADIHKIVEYAFYRVFGANTNLITLCCVGKTKKQIMPEIMEVLATDTEYKKFLASKEER